VSFRELRKATLKQYLQQARDALLWKLDGLSERELRMPRTPTGTSLAGGFYRRVWVFADTTIDELPLDAVGSPPWWPAYVAKLTHIARSFPEASLPPHHLDA
jgi:hypothetical protein